VTPPELSPGAREDDFDFKRLGIRVPTIMVSSHIARNTVVNTPMHHGSFLNTVATKWNKIVPGKFPPLSKRVEDAPLFTEVFTSATPRPRAEWPVIQKPYVPPEFWAIDFSQIPLTKFERQMLDATAQLPAVQAEAQARKKRGAPVPQPENVRTVGEALGYLRSIPGLGKEEPHLT
jgi:Phosphoesterase family